MTIFSSLRPGRALTGLLAALPLLAAASPLPDTLEQRVAPCIACHQVKEKSDAYFPRISGKPAGYLYNQLLNFRDGRRQYPMMSYMVEQLPEAYLREIAQYFSDQHPPYPAPEPTSATPAMVERGRMLALHGDPAKKIPACVACHGAQLTGVAPSIPGLIGLPRDYINAQFGAWKNKVRKAHAPDCMAEVASRLTEADVAAVSGWLAAQPADPAARPAEALPQPLPLACGGVPQRGTP
ncbi:c-type cytochrome [Massilia endophytica]|uniref:c-type cytochrome n=1 Tax=Massilia endophytica TaxID=2899220 RepID=UPI001E493FC4|nr:c-type cytochrome [Massilia endophytica]UGQ47905.1 c-type cytochrome [Massilia endophytica]